MAKFPPPPPPRGPPKGGPPQPIEKKKNCPTRPFPVFFLKPLRKTPKRVLKEAHSEPKVKVSLPSTEHRVSRESGLRTTFHQTGPLVARSFVVDQSENSRVKTTLAGGGRCPKNSVPHFTQFLRIDSNHQSRLIVERRILAIDASLEIKSP